MMAAVNAASRTCPHIPKNTRGCPKNIPSVSDHGAVQSCPSGGGFWPVGSACSVTCAAGGGHRRTQAGDSMYFCTSGGDWLSASPISCNAAAGPPPTPGSPTAGRFQVYPQPMTITDAVTHCRTQGGSLASVHSAQEQDQVVSVCQSMRTDATTGATVAGDQATHGGYGCWIGFEDSGSDGGFVWTDGSNVDYGTCRCCLCIYMPAIDRSLPDCSELLPGRAERQPLPDRWPPGQLLLRRLRRLARIHGRPWHGSRRISRRSRPQWWLERRLS